MKVLIVNKYHYARGGSETYCMGLEKALQQAGHSVVFFAMQHPSNVPTPHSSYWVPNTNYEAKGLAATAKAAAGLLYSATAKHNMWALLQEEKPDIAILNLVTRQITFSILGPLRRQGVPVVWVLHDMACLCPSYHMYRNGAVCTSCLHRGPVACIVHKCIKNSLLKSVAGAAECGFNRARGYYKKIDLYIAPSKFHRDFLLRQNFTHRPIVHLDNPLWPGTHFGSTAAKGRYFLYYGRLSSEKGVDTLLYALRQTKSALPLYVVGRGPAQNSLVKLAGKLGLAGRVQFMGHKTGRALRQIICGSCCVIAPSRWCEIGPYTLMEAAALGKPCLGSHLGATPERIDDGVTGYLFEAGNAAMLAQKMDKVAYMEERAYHQMGEKAAQRAAQLYSMQGYIKRLGALFERQFGPGFAL